MYPAILAAESLIRPYVLETPLAYSPALSARCGYPVWLKLECVQHTGSFKLRGAAHALLRLDAETRRRGVVTASTGNHGEAMAYMAQRLGIPCTLCVPETITPAKLAHFAYYPVEVRVTGADSAETELTARALATAEGLRYVSPYNDPDVIAGQGTLGPELLRQCPDLGTVLVPIGGGGLIGGIAAYLKAVRPEIQVIGCQPAHDAAMYHALRTGQVVDVPALPTLSDGTAGGLEPDTLTLPLCQDHVDDITLIEESEIRQALRWLVTHHQLLVEGAAALQVAALLRDPAPRYPGPVVLILCGRKLGLDTLRDLLLTGEGLPG
ncbi:MAG: threonine/serine dehydratase [Bacteroidia bacterium]|nr:threonine/serine dehydratase [Bacteroidia bacterium]